MAHKPVTSEQCDKRTSELSKQIRVLEKQNGRIDEGINGKLGVVYHIKQLSKEVTKAKDDIAYVKANGTLQGKDKVKVYLAIVGTISSIGLALIALFS